MRKTIIQSNHTLHDGVIHCDGVIWHKTLCHKQIVLTQLFTLAGKLRSLFCPFIRGVCQTWGLCICCKNLRDFWKWQKFILFARKAPAFNGIFIFNLTFSRLYIPLLCMATHKPACLVRFIHKSATAYIWMGETTLTFAISFWHAILSTASNCPHSLQMMYFIQASYCYIYSQYLWSLHSIHAKVAILLIHWHIGLLAWHSCQTTKPNRVSHRNCAKHNY